MNMLLKVGNDQTEAEEAELGRRVKSKPTLGLTGPAESP